MFLMLTIGITCVVAQDSLPDPPDTVFVLNLTTFTGIVAAISLVGTQLVKLIPAIGNSTLLKILASVVIGIAATLISWHFGWADFLIGLNWWKAIIYGFLSGLTASGAYDLINNTFKKE